ncbi:MAG: hypothetical protein ACI9EW_001703, partial [Cellvibrionaceae bacterium]
TIAQKINLHICHKPFNKKRRHSSEIIPSSYRNQVKLNRHLITDETTKLFLTKKP